MPWIGFDAKYIPEPSTSAVAIGGGVSLARSEAAGDMLFANAEGYDQSGDLPKPKTMKKKPLSEPLPQSILDQIRAREKARAKAAKGG